MSLTIYNYALFNQKRKSGKENINLHAHNTMHSSHISLSQEEIINLFYIQVNQSNLTIETHPLFLTS